MPAARTFLPAQLEWPTPVPCGPFECFHFDAADRAVAALLLHEKAPLVGFGEAHAPAEYDGSTTVERFTELLLPTFARGVSALVVELLAPPAAGCEREKEVAQKESDAITSGQSQSNRNHYLTLGQRAAAQGIVPEILRASCDDLRKIAAPDGGVLAYMDTIARLFEEELSRQIDNRKPGRPFVMAYGGALHNDRLPRKERESWSYVPGLMKRSGLPYLEVDLILPALIRDTPSWKGLPWYDTYRALHHTTGSWVLRLGTGSYVVFFAPD